MLTGFFRLPLALLCALLSLNFDDIIFHTQADKVERIYNKTRIAPTPSGFLHPGNIYSFLLTVSLARETGAGVLLRIDDLDRERVRKEYIDDIFSTLNFMGISWDEGPVATEQFEKRYSQRHRLLLYQEAFSQLADLDAVYACTCSRLDLARDNTNRQYSGACRNKRISLQQPGACWRLKTDISRTLSMKQFKGCSVESVLPVKMKDFIVKKKDGNPSYMLASVVDDVHFGVDLIVRGEDLRESTFAQLYLAQVLENSFLKATFHHHSLLTKKELKLSKSTGAGSIKFLREQGFSRGHILSLIEQWPKTQ